MANDVRNVLTFNASDKELNEILNAIKVDAEGIGSIDFNKLIPMPPELNFDDELDVKRGVEVFNFYNDWRMKIEKKLSNPDISNKEFEATEAEKKLYESKVNLLMGDYKKLYDIGKQYSDNIAKYGHGDWYGWSRENWGTKWEAYKFSHYDNSIEFLTANETPTPIIKLLSEKYPDVEMIHQWADANWGHNLGVREYKNGDVVYQHIPDAGTVEAYDMAFKIWHTTPQDCGYALNPDGDGYISTEESATLSSFEFADEDNDEIEL